MNALEKLGYVKQRNEDKEPFIDTYLKNEDVVMYRIKLMVQSHTEYVAKVESLDASKEEWESEYGTQSELKAILELMEE